MIEVLARGGVVEAAAIPSATSSSAIGIFSQDANFTNDVSKINATVPMSKFIFFFIQMRN